jgi:hypothetical protein
VPITGGEAISTGGGTGVAHDCHDFGTERFANGLAKGMSSFCWLGSLGLFGFDSGTEKALDGIPALRRAIFVVSLLNILRRGFSWG